MRLSILGKRGIIWKLKTALFKQWIRLQNRLGLYRYTDWIRENEPPRLPLAAVSYAESALPLVSFLLLVDRQGERNLANTITSLIAQTDTRWEGFILQTEAFDLKISSISNPPDLDERVRCIDAQTGGWKSALGQALAEAKGKFVTILSSGDTLAPYALQELQQYNDLNPETSLWYSDEDILSPDGQHRHTPFFKPDWSPELLLSKNYLQGAFIERTLLENELSAGQSLNDVIYRCAENAAGVGHIPKVLYHRRKAGSHRWLGDPVPENVLAAHLTRQGLQDVQTSRTAKDHIRVSWNAGTPLVSIVIPTKDKVPYLRRCLKSIKTFANYPNYEIILVDNNSHESQTHSYYQTLQNVPRIKIVQFTGPFNFSAALNLGARSAQGGVLLFLNNDTQAFEAGWLTELVRWATRPQIGIVGPKLLYPDHRIQHAGIVVGMEGHASHVFGGEHEGATGPFGSVEWYRNYTAVTGACLAVRQELFNKIGGFDETYELVFSDIEICLRCIQAGYRVVYTPYARLIHHEGRTRLRHIPQHDIQLAYQHLKELVTLGDPYYNPNLSTAVRIPTLRRSGEEEPIDRLDTILKYA